MPLAPGPADPLECVCWACSTGVLRATAANTAASQSSLISSPAEVSALYALPYGRQQACRPACLRRIAPCGYPLCGCGPGEEPVVDGCNRSKHKRGAQRPKHQTPDKAAERQGTGHSRQV